jgi:hypothetical protein
MPQNLEKNSLLSPIHEAISSDPFNLVDLGIPGLRHCMFRYHAQNLFVEMTPISPYNNSQERKRLLRLYQSVMEKASSVSSTSSLGQQIKLSFHVTASESVLVQVRDIIMARSVYLIYMLNV